MRTFEIPIHKSLATWQSRRHMLLPDSLCLTPSQNAWAANYDETPFKSPREFVPERYLDTPEGIGDSPLCFRRRCQSLHRLAAGLSVTLYRLSPAYPCLPDFAGL